MWKLMAECPYCKRLLERPMPHKCGSNFRKNFHGRPWRAVVAEKSAKMQAAAEWLKGELLNMLPPDKDDSPKPRFDLLPLGGICVMAQRVADNCATHGERGGQLGTVTKEVLVEKMLRHAHFAACPVQGDAERTADHAAAAAFNALLLVEKLNEDRDRTGKE